MAIFFITSLLFTTSYFVQSGEAPTTRVKPENSADAMVVPMCSEPRPHLRRIGWKSGPQFDVSKPEVKVLGGKPDVDYVRLCDPAQDWTGISGTLVWSLRLPSQSRRGTLDQIRQLSKKGCCQRNRRTHGYRQLGKATNRRSMAARFSRDFGHEWGVV